MTEKSHLHIVVINFNSVLIILCVSEDIIDEKTSSGDCNSPDSAFISIEEVFFAAFAVKKYCLDFNGVVILWRYLLLSDIRKLVQC